MREFIEDILFEFNKIILEKDGSYKKVEKSDDFIGYTLNNGYAAMIIYLIEGKEFIDDVQWEEELKYYLLNFMEVLKYEKDFIKLSTGGLNGLCNVALVLKKLQDIGIKVDKVLEEINNRIIDRVNNELDLAYTNIFNKKLNSVDYDLLGGLTTTFRYSINLYEVPEFKDICNKIVEYYYTLIQNRKIGTDDIPNFTVFNKINFETGEIRDPELDFSLSHGLGGVLSVLSIAKLKDIHFKKQDEIIKSILEMYKNNTREKNQFIYWNSIIKLKDYIKNDVNEEAYTLSWCYGIPGIARSIYLGAKAIGDMEMERVSIKAFEQIAYNISNIKMRNSIICHGYSGLLYTFLIMYKDTRLDLLKEAAEEIMKKIREEYNKENGYGFSGEFYRKENVVDSYSCIGILEGAIGIYLTLLCYKTDKDSILKEILCLG